MSGYKRLVINIAPEVVAELDRVATVMGITETGNQRLTQVIKRAVALQRYVCDHMDGVGVYPCTAEQFTETYECVGDDPTQEGGQP